MVSRQALVGSEGHPSSSLPRISWPRNGAAPTANLTGPAWRRIKVS